MLQSKALPLCVLFFALSHFTVQAAQAESENRLRLNASTNATKGLALSYDDCAGVSLEYSRSVFDHIEFGVSALDVFFSSGSNVYTFSFNPAFYEDLGDFHLYAGPSFGEILRREDTFEINVNTSNFGLGGFVGVDFNFTEHWLGNAAIHYLSSLDTPALSVFSFAAGVGYRF